jgi:streptomycin 6-kinase
VASHLQAAIPGEGLHQFVRQVPNLFDESRVLAWAFAHSVLSTCWSVEDKQPWQEGLACARLMAEALR